MKDERDEVIDMFGMLIEKGIIVSDHGTITSRIKWLGQNRQVRLGAFSNRIGVD